MEGDNQKTALFAAGCFWGIEDAFLGLKGVIETAVGYSGGHIKNPTYEQVCTGDTGHAEVVEVVYDSEKISYESLLNTFWKIHDPTTLNRQGPDVGEQYRSAIFYTGDEQKKIAEASKEKEEASGKYEGDIVTEITQAEEFYKAEEYHQKYFQKQGIKGTCHN